MMKLLCYVVGLVLFISQDVSAGEAVSFSLNDAAPSSARSSIIAPSCRISTSVTLSQKKITADFGAVLKAGGQAAEDVDAEDEDSVVLASTFNSNLGGAGVSSVKFDSKMPSNASPSKGGVAGGAAVGGDFAPYPYPGPYPGPIFAGYCPSIRTTIQPTWAINIHHRWVRLFQSYYFRQRFQVVYCTSSYCNSFYYPVGLDTPVGGPVGGGGVYQPYYYPPVGRCYIKYQYYYALVITGCGGGFSYWGGLNLEVQLIRLPGSCTCRNDFIHPYRGK